MSPDCQIRSLEAADAELLSAAFSQIGWHKPASLFQRYVEEQEAGTRSGFVAELPDGIAGYVSILWQPPYRPFRDAGTPEISDLNVLPSLQRRGIGSALLDAAEAQCATVSAVAGIGVGLTGDYGAAQALYARRGYVPDGRGVHDGGEPLSIGDRLTVSDDLVLYLTKQLQVPRDKD